MTTRVRLTVDLELDCEGPSELHNLAIDKLMEVAHVANDHGILIYCAHGHTSWVGNECGLCDDLGIAPVNSTEPLAPPPRLL